MTSFTRIARGLTRAAIMVCIGVVLLHFFLSPQGWSRALILLTTALMCTFTGLFRLLFFRTQARLPKPFAPVRVVIVGLGEDAAALSARISRYGHGAYEVALTAFALGRQDALTLATRADQMGLKVFQVPFTWGAVSPRVDLARVGDLQLIDLTVLSYPSWAELVKRVMDLVLVSLGGLVLAPFLLLVALAIKVQDGGPVLFVQPRSGRGGRQFPFFKFRSMVVNAEAQQESLLNQNESDGVLFKIAEDPRVTRVGRFIRRWSIDELPQLWNVVRGDMNLVGPRPLPMRDLQGAEKDQEIRYWLELRGKVKPGITGPWQVSGRSNLGFQDMVQLDIAYVQNWDLWIDVLTLLRTVPAVLRRRGAV